MKEIHSKPDLTVSVTPVTAAPVMIDSSSKHPVHRHPNQQRHHSPPRYPPCHVSLNALLRTMPDDRMSCGQDSHDLTVLEGEQDVDQRELTRRMHKYLVLKDTLQQVLSTLQDTHDEQVLGMKKIKRMRVEMVVSNLTCGMGAGT